MAEKNRSCIPHGFGMAGKKRGHVPFGDMMAGKKQRRIPHGNMMARAMQAGKKQRRIPHGFGMAGKKVGQSISFDFMMACFIFLLVFGFYLISWDDFSTRLVDNAVRSRMELQAITASKMLVETPGHPFNWTMDPDAAQSVGLAGRQGKLDAARVAALQSMQYANARAALGLDNDFLVKIDNIDGTRYATIGIENSTNSNTVEVSRVAEVGGNTVLVRVRLYDN